MIRNNVDAIKAEIFARGPVAAEIAGAPLHTYEGGVFDDEDAPQKTTHIVSIVGWGTRERHGSQTQQQQQQQYWIVRNSWGQYWGEMGYFRIAMGSNILGIESGVAWATPGQWSESNYPCTESGNNCGPTTITRYYTDPSKDMESLLRRLESRHST